MLMVRFAVKIGAARDDEEEPVVEEEDQEDDSMALFAKKNKKRKDVDAAENMQGHAYFAAMLGILFTHGNIHTLPGKGDPSAAEPWTGLQQLHANLGAGFGLLLFLPWQVWEMSGPSGSAAASKNRRPGRCSSLS